MSLRYIGPFEVLKRVVEATYELALPPNFPATHLVFHVSMLKKYVSYGSHRLQHESLMSNPTYLTVMRLCRFLTIYKESVGRRYLSLMYYGHGKELRRPRGNVRTGCSTFPGSSQRATTIQGISTLPCFLWLCAIV